MTGRTPVSTGVLAAFLVLAASAACREKATTGPAQRQSKDFAAAVRSVSGDQQVGAAGARLAQSLTVRVPSRSRADYTLRVNGLVDSPFELTYDELVAMPPTKLTRDFQCVTGWRVSDVEWKGVRLSDLLDRAGVHSNAKALRFHSFDGAYTESLTL